MTTPTTKIKKVYIAIKIINGKPVTCLGVRGTLAAIKKLYPEADHYMEASRVE